MSGSSESSLGESWVAARFPRVVHMFRYVIAPTIWLGVVICILVTPGTLRAEEPALRLGWRGNYLIGCWAEAAIRLDVPEPGSYEVRVVAPDPDGNRVSFISTVDAIRGNQTLRGYFKVGNTNPEVDVAVFATKSDKPIWAWRSREHSGEQPATPLDPGIRLIVTVGNPPGFDWEESRGDPSKSSDKQVSARVTNVAVDELPIDARAYDSVSTLVIAGSTVLSEVQAEAVRQWVARGGRLLISLPQDPKQSQVMIKPFAAWLPVTVGDLPVTVSEFGKLESFARKNVRILLGRLAIPSVKVVQGEVLAGSRDDALLVRSPYGLGATTVLAMDLTQAPLNKWSELQSLAQRLTDTSDSATAGTSTPRNSQLSSTGITDFATQLHAVQEDFAGINRASPWFVMGLMVLLLLAIGPIDYLLVHRVLHRPRATWVTFPIWIAGAAVVSASLANSWNGASYRLNQLNIVNVDVASSSCHQRLWTNLYSPSNERQTLTVASKIAPGTKSQQVGWSGIAETTFGGMLRPANVQVGATDYKVTSESSIEDLPLMQWSSLPLLTEVHSVDDTLVESNLQSNGIGQLSGTITHRLPGQIEDWVLAFDKRIYRHKKNREDLHSLPLLPRQVLRVDQPNVFPRELRAFLTGKVGTGKREGSQASDVANQFISYDSLSRNPADALRILTFHNEVGGTKYTGLTNRLLEKEDLSHLLKLGRAILLGRLNSPIASLQLNGKEISPDREATFVRIVLPVKKLNSELRPMLERLDK